MMRSDSSKRSSSSEPEGAELVYFKDNVTIHPAQFASERISGRLMLIKQGSSLFMTWTPYKRQNSTARLSERDRNLYTIGAVPFTEVRSIGRHMPAFGLQYIIIVLSSGLTFPLLYFYTGGVREFLATVKQHVLLVRSAEDANVFLVNDFDNPLQRTLSSLELPRVVSIASGSSTPVSVGDSPTNVHQERTNGGLGHESHDISQFNGRHRQKAHDPTRDISIQVFEKFSLVTKFARETTSQLFRENHINGFGAFEKKFDSQSAQDFDHNTSNDMEKIVDEITVAADPMEWDNKIMKKKVDEEKGEAQQQLKLKRKHKDVFPFGNYRNYYGYRVGEGLDEDPRFKVLRKEWFKGKDCLDIGCNSGVITIQIAQKFCCRSILGIDIDSNLVANAYWHLRKTVKMEQDGKKRANASIIEITEKGDGLNHRVTGAHEKKKEISRGDFTHAERDLLDIVSFKQENFVHSWETPEKYYDAILCLSVTKWIHLNWGDDGLITLFTRIWRLLHPGGVFVLEPQPWKSYENNRRVSETTAMNFQNIKLYPEQFQEILLDKIGFRTVEDITSGGLSGSKIGFNRPILLFRK